MNETLEKELHVKARKLIADAKAQGWRVDKKIGRFNDIVAAAIRYGQCGTEFRPDVARASLREIVESCLVGNSMHSGKSPRELAPDWMLAS